jgi:hydrogenase maturation protease
MTEKHLHIIGLGNITRLDDGIAIQIINEIAEWDLPPGIKVTDLGSGGVDVALHLDGWKKGIIIDAINTEFLLPGEIFEVIITKDKLPEIKGIRSTHDFDIVTSLKLAYKVDEFKLPAKILLIGIQIKTIDGFGIELSDEVKEVIPVVKMRIKEIISSVIK